MEKSKKRKKISITKYDIANRDERGIYRKDEWASISDIGKFYNNELFIYDDYYKIETLYVNAVNLIMDFFNSNSIEVSHVFKLKIIANAENKNSLDLLDTYNFIKKGSVITDKKTIEDLVRLRLREHIFELEIYVDKSSKSEILFGFDYYMYLKTNKNISDLSVKIQNLGLFVL